MASWQEFHERCGNGINLSNHRRKAARNSPESEFDNGLVFSKGILPQKTIFEVEIESKTTLWSGSLAIGVTLNDPSSLEEIPSSVSHLKNGTWVLAGSSILRDGLAICDDYAGNLEQLGVGDKVGVMRLMSGNLHFFINGKDMGCAAKGVPGSVFVVVDVYGRCSHVKICNESGSQDNGVDSQGTVALNKGLCFHSFCGSCVRLSNNRKTVFRPNPNEDFNNGIALTEQHLAQDFNNGIALTERPLAQGEILEIQIQELIDKWAGSLEIGVTTHVPGSFQLPATMTNVSSGTWMLSGGAIVHNGTTVLDSYGRDISAYKVGDKLSVCVNSDSTLHFYYNGVDLGCAASELPSPLYAVVDIYGQAVQATIVDSGAKNEILQPTTPVSTLRNAQPVDGGTDNQLASSNRNRPKFSEVHGRLIALNEDRTGASRLNAPTEFNHAVVVSEQPLEDDFLFEVEIEKTTDRWSGSLEVGLLSLAPPDLELPITLTDLNHHAWVLSGESVMQDGTTTLNGYGVDLDSVGVGTRVGVMRKADGTFHVFVNGEDKGTAATFVPPGVFAAFDLYGQCVQVAVVTTECQNTGLASSRTSSAESLIDESMLDLLYSFHSCGGENIAFRNHGHTAVRVGNFNGGLVFSDKPLQDDDIFEVRIDKTDEKWTGALCIGVTALQLPLAKVPPQVGELRNNTTFISGSSVFKDDVKVRSFGVSLDRLQEGSRVGIQRHYEGSLHVYIDSKRKGIAATNVPAGVYGVVDVYGSTQSVSIVNTTNRILSDKDVSSDDELFTSQTQKPEPTIPELSFHSKCGLNVIMDTTCTTARRKARFNEGLVFSRKPLANKEMFQVRVDSLNPCWSGSLAVGIIGIHSLEKLNLSPTAVSLRLNSCTVVHGSQIYINGVKTELNYGCNFDNLREGDRVGVICDDDHRLHVIVNDVDQGLVDHEVPGTKYALLDLYGRCEQVSVVPSNKVPELRTKGVISEGKEQEGVRNEEKLPVTVDKEKVSKEQFFTKNVTCYCSNCCAARDESHDAISGDPPQEYHRPVGWCKFELRLPPNLNSMQILRCCHVAYIVVHVGAIRRTLDRGTVLPPRKSSRVIGGNGDKKVLVSPSISRATTLSNEKNFLFTDTTSGKRWSTHVAFELRLPADCYTPCTLGKTEVATRDWCLNLPANIALTGLLVKISEDR